jgi:hypothetical protein
LYTHIWQAGANVNDVNNNSLARAASEGLTEIVKCLLEAGADANRPDEVIFSLVFHDYHSELIYFGASEVLDFWHQHNAM